MKKLFPVLAMMIACSASANEKSWVIYCQKFVSQGLQFGVLINGSKDGSMVCDVHTYDWHAWGKSGIESFYKKPCLVTYNITKKKYQFATLDKAMSGEIFVAHEDVRVTTVGGYTEGVDSFNYPATLVSGVKNYTSDGFTCEFYKKLTFKK